MFAGTDSISIYIVKCWQYVPSEHSLVAASRGCSQQMIPFNKPYIAGKEFFYIAQAVALGNIGGDGRFTQNAAPAGGSIRHPARCC